MSSQGSNNNNDAFYGAAMQFMQASQNMTQSFLEFMGKAANQAPGNLPPPPADPQQITELQKRLFNQQMELWQSVLGKGQGKPAEFEVKPEAGDRRFSAPEWHESPFYDYLHQAYLLNANYVRELVELAPAEDEKSKNRLRFIARQLIDALAPSNFAATNPEFVKQALETKGQSITEGINNLIKDF